MKNPKNRIKQLRNEHIPKLTQENLANEMGVTKLTISRWENEEVQIKPDKAKELADYFGVSVAYLLGYYDYRSIDDEMNDLKKAVDEETLEIFKDFLLFLQESDMRITNSQIDLIFNLLISIDENRGVNFRIDLNNEDENNLYSWIDNDTKAPPAEN